LTIIVKVKKKYYYYSIVEVSVSENIMITYKNCCTCGTYTRV